MNILNAIINLANNPIYELKEFYESRNRANSMGGALEEYVKDLFANTLNEQNSVIRNEKHSEIFSYLGNQNNPPDSMIRGGDAIEVKKIESKGSSLALNSSYPKSKIYANNKMITSACKNCEQWDVKDIIYAVGVVNKNDLKSLCFVYGVDYAASAEIYERVKTAISSGILTIPDIEFSETKELGRVNKVDPLGITNLRIRGMWHIQNPMKTFNYAYNEPINKEFTFMAIINEEKYYSFDNKLIKDLENCIKNTTNLEINEIKIHNPDNPAIMKEAKLITYYR